MRVYGTCYLCFFDTLGEAALCRVWILFFILVSRYQRNVSPCDLDLTMIPVLSFEIAVVIALRTVAFTRRNKLVLFIICPAFLALAVAQILNFTVHVHG